MKPALTVLTLAVEDLERAVRFYRDGLGFPTQGIIGTEFEIGAVAFFDLAGGTKLALWPRKSLAIDTGLSIASASNGPTCSLAHNVGSDREVDEAMALADKAGARIVKAPHKTFYGGYAGYFTDPDGHLWEVVHAPGFAAA
jgi:catechol 2,3-dioxygenase-like lactoylglutathione lyase family enzyme